MNSALSWTKNSVSQQDFHISDLASKKKTIKCIKNGHWDYESKKWFVNQKSKIKKSTPFVKESKNCKWLFIMSMVLVAYWGSWKKNSFLGSNFAFRVFFFLLLLYASSQHQIKKKERTTCRLDRKSAAFGNRKIFISVNQILVLLFL